MMEISYPEMHPDLLQPQLAMNYHIKFMAYCFRYLDLSTFGRKAFCTLENQENNKKIIRDNFLDFHNFTNDNDIVVIHKPYSLIQYIAKQYYLSTRPRNKYSTTMQYLQVTNHTLSP